MPPCKCSSRRRRSREGDSRIYPVGTFRETADLRKEIKRRCDEMQLAQRESLERDAERHLRTFFYYRKDETEFDLEEAKEAMGYLLERELDEWVRLEFNFQDVGDRIQSFLRESSDLAYGQVK